MLSKLPLDVRQSDLKAALPGLSAFKRYRSVSGRWLPAGGLTPIVVKSK